MASAMAASRLRKELMAIKKNPVEHIVATPLDSNILEWHYVITGSKGSPYEGGHYHGKLKFPSEYPMKPPSIMMVTPNGRFQRSKRLCLSMSDFHPESWNPMWSVSTILMGLYSFMLETAPTGGSMTSSIAQKRKFASESLEFNCQNSVFRKLFPELVQLHERRKEEVARAGTIDAVDSGISQSNKARSAGASGSGAKRVAGGGDGLYERDSACTMVCGVLWLAVIVGLCSIAYAWQSRGG